MRFIKLGCAVAALALGGCVSIGSGDEAPDQLLTLTPAAIAPAGDAATGDMASALAVTEPSTPQHLNVIRIPVRLNDSSLAYLQDAFWVQKPSQLFQRVLAETIRATSDRLVIGGGELDYAARTQLGGELVAMDYDVPSSSVVVRYDAVLRQPDGDVRTQRFESVVSGVAPDALSVGPAFNQAVNEVAAQVADWVG